MHGQTRANSEHTEIHHAICTGQTSRTCKLWTQQQLGGVEFLGGWLIYERPEPIRGRAGLFSVDRQHKFDQVIYGVTRPGKCAPIFDFLMGAKLIDDYSKLPVKVKAFLHDLIIIII